ncbi:lipoprotein insertase outer membrane protein LolB [Candidatus Accumulibacter vicinus]|uniref:lipoprotein insertase outer membrane protein LolB n=1 Tax=Candidatus Accumulibacter vicinus TaxID=2954382 RepID=UPI0005576E67|nr:lipoprotein insertase outer membrane protein LolB [Candidatus Accumulibacter vicinus]
MIGVGVLGLGACSALGPAASARPTVTIARDRLQGFSLTGRFALRQEGKNYPGRLYWRHDGDRDELLLSSPLGQGLAEIVSDAAGARLTGSDGNSHTAATADQLLQSLLAYPLPLSRLPDWLRGCNPDGGRLALDTLGRPLRLRYEDWRIDYEYDNDDPQALPGRLFVEREDGFELRLRIEEWQMLPTALPAKACAQ